MNNARSSPRWKRLAQGDTPLILLFLVVSGTSTLAYCAFFFGHERAYEASGVAQSAEVIGKSTWVERGRAGTRTHYVLRYRFQDAAKDPHEGSGDVHRDDWDRFREGDRLPILYLPDRPDLSRPALLPPRRYRLPLFALIGLGSLLLGGALAFAAHRWSRPVDPSRS